MKCLKIGMNGSHIYKSPRRRLKMNVLFDKQSKIQNIQFTIMLVELELVLLFP